MNRPEVTMFMLQSIDGKISFNGSSFLDFDKDIPKFKYLKQGINQYYELEKQTDDWTICSAKTLQKVGWTSEVVKVLEDVSIVVIDYEGITYKPFIENICKGFKNVVFVQRYNRRSQLCAASVPNLRIIEYNIDSGFRCVLEQIYQEYGCKKITLQGGGTINSAFMCENLIDNINIVVAPMLVGGKDTPATVDGKCFGTPLELYEYLCQYELVDVKMLENSYVNMRYKFHCTGG